MNTPLENATAFESKIPAQAIFSKFRTRNDEFVQNVHLTREKQPNQLETWAANLVNLMGFERIGKYKTTRVVGYGDVLDDNGAVLWRVDVAGRNGFEKIIPKSMNEPEPVVPCAKIKDEFYKP